jgi:methylmalonyl-CoA mutase
MMLNDFPKADEAQWRARVDAVLKGAAFQEKLVSLTHDGIAIQPLELRREDAAPIGKATGAAPWHICQRVDHPDPTIANTLALTDLENGADALSLVFAGSSHARDFGLVATSVDDLDTALAGVRLDLIRLRLDPASRADRALLVDLIHRRGLRPADMTVDFGLDPLGQLATRGALRATWAQTGWAMADDVTRLRQAGFKGSILLCDGRPVHAAGGSEAQELAQVLASAIAYLRALEANGVPLETARQSLSCLLVADADAFITMAKFRALRQLMAKVDAECGLAPYPLFVQGETAWRMLTKRDPWVNLLRNTVATFAAGLGGADGITVLPFTSALGLPDAFARRLARNTQAVLLEEANLWRVADPAAGAGSVEALTGDLCQKAWELFQEIEHHGGLARALTDGIWQLRIASVREARLAAVEAGRDPITGTTTYPALNETPVAVLDVPVIPPASPQGPMALETVALPAIRLAEPFET